MPKENAFKVYVNVLMGILEKIAQLFVAQVAVVAVLLVAQHAKLIIIYRMDLAINAQVTA